MPPRGTTMHVNGDGIAEIGDSIAEMYKAAQPSALPVPYLSSRVRKSCVDIRLPLAISMICSAASWTSGCDVVTHSAKMTVSKPWERALHAVNSTHTFVSMPVT